MKNLIYVISIILLVSCGAEDAKETIAEVKAPAEDSGIGFNTNLPELKWHLGTEAAIQVVKDLDKLWSAKNYEGMRPMLADTAKFTFYDGKKAESADEFIKILTEDENSDTWTFDNAYSVDLNPEIGGEHVQANFTGYAVEDGDTTRTYYHESYYIIQGKVIWWNQFTQKEKN